MRILAGVDKNVGVLIIMGVFFLISAIFWVWILSNSSVDEALENTTTQGPIEN